MAAFYFAVYQATGMQKMYLYTLFFLHTGAVRYVHYVVQKLTSVWLNPVFSLATLKQKNTINLGQRVAFFFLLHTISGNYTG